MLLVVVIIVIIIAIAIVAGENRKQLEYKQLEADALSKLGFSSWNVISYYDKTITVKSRQALEKYDDIRFFKENKEALEWAERVIERKKN